MDFDNILKEVNDIFKDELDNDELVIKPETSANDVDEWDSLSHILLIVAIEKHFGITFTASEIRVWQNVGEMCRSIEKRVNSK